ncbi:DUF6233 domain-containing protein [Streptomyces olivaceoviridis]|uniref:DUF6233 domain-containing protein n=1 Tax=Streptomyces olivaceoviridis TaxID=1921 RepID=UPI0036A707DE
MRWTSCSSNRSGRARRGEEPKTTGWDRIKKVHRDTCLMAGKRPRPVGPDEARRLLADGTSACSHCCPDTLSASSAYSG